MLLIDADIELSDVLTTIVETAVGLSGARFGALGVLDDAGTALSRFITVGIDEDQRESIGPLPSGRGLLGLLIREPQTLRLRDLNEHPASAGFPPNHPQMRSFLGVPIQVRGDLFGNLYLCDKQGADEFTDEDEAVLEGLSVAAGLSIDKARLHDRLRELTLTEERERMARNLHDTVIQRLFAVGLSLQSAMRYANREEVSTRMQEAIDDLDATVRQIRTTIFAISRPRTESGQGALRAEILDLVDEAGTKLGLRTRVDFEGPIDAAVGPQAAEHLLYSLREALSNVVRHAQAKDAEVEISVVSDELVLTVRDDGVGLKNGRGQAGGRGLSNLAERAKLLGGSFEVADREGGGTELVWRAKRFS
jgi:signal transduction histidine kinase